MKKLRLVLFSILMMSMVSGCSLFSSDSSTQTGRETVSPSGTPRTDMDEDQQTPEPQEEEGTKISMSLYFANQDNSAMMKEVREVHVEDKAVLKAAVEALIDGPSDDAHRSTIPEGTSLLGINKKEDVAIVNFSKEFASANDIAGIVARASVVNTLTEVEGIKKVQILIEGEDLIGPSGKPIGEMKRFSLDGEGKPVGNVSQSVTLYFANSGSEGVLPEQRQVVVGDGESLESVIFEELKEGSRKEGMFPVIPEGTKLLGIQTQSGLCTINLSKEFVENNYSGSAGEAMTLYAIVNSLTELPNIKKVQFLVEGKVREVYIHNVLDEPFERNESYIVK